MIATHHHLKRSWALFLALILSGSTGFAAETNSVLEPLLGKPADVGPSLLRVLGSLAVVLGVFLGGIWLYRNGRSLAFRGGRTPHLNVLECRSLGARQALYVVGYDQERFLVAATPAGINLLSHLPSANPAELSEERPAAPSFAQALTQVLKGRPSGKTGAGQ
jgi:flagellar biogenesis protein FliO